MAKKKPKYYVRPDGIHEAIRVIDGKRVAFRGKTDAEVERKMLVWRGEQKEKTRFKTVAEAWWDVHEPTLAYNSTKNYAPALERAIKKFGDDYVEDITALDVDEYIKDYCRGGRSRKVVATQLQIIRQVLDYAALQGYLSANPAKVVKVPRGLPRAYRMPPTPEEIKKIKEHASDHLLPFLIYETGCRHGEAMGLRWEDIDRKKKLVHIRRSVYYVSTVPYLKEPKSAAGLRDVPLLDALDAALPKKLPKGYIFSDDAGKSPLKKSPALRMYAAFQQETGVQVTCHQIRHAYATALMEAGIAPKVAQVLLGHAQLSTTMDIYTHVMENQLTQAAEKMNAAL